MSTTRKSPLAISSGIEASVFRFLHLLTILLVLLPTLLLSSSSSSSSSSSPYNVFASGQEQDGAVERDRQQRQQEQRERYLSRLYWEKHERGEEEDLDNLWKDVESMESGSTRASIWREKSGRASRANSIHLWDSMDGDEFGGEGEDEDENEDEDEDQYAYSMDEEREEEEGVLEDVDFENDMSETADPEVMENTDSNIKDNEEDGSEEIKPDRVVLADIRTILEVNVRKEQQGFLPQKVVVLLNEMVNGTEVEGEEEEEEEEGTGGERILSQHLCWAFLNEEGDIWPEHEYPCYEWYRPQRKSLNDGFEKDFRAAMNFIERVDDGRKRAAETYTMRLGKYWSIGNMFVFMKRPGGTLNLDWSTGSRIRDMVDCEAVEGVECNMRPDMEGKEVIWRLPRSQKSM